MSEHEYMSDPRAKTVAGFVAGIEILVKYMDDGMDEWFPAAAEHDIIYVGVSEDKLPEDSEDGLMLRRLGFHISGDAWAYFA